MPVCPTEVPFLGVPAARRIYQFDAADCATIGAALYQMCLAHDRTAASM